MGLITVNYTIIFPQHTNDSISASWVKHNILIVRIYRAKDPLPALAHILLN